MNRGCLCSRVVVPSQSCSHSVDARDVDDAAHSLYGHDERRIFHAGEDGTQVHGYNRIELFQINVSNGGELRASPGVVYQAIEAAKAVDSMVDHCLDVCFDGDIRAYETRAAPSFCASLSPLSDSPIKQYSSGMYMRLAFSVATQVDPDILIIVFPASRNCPIRSKHFSRKPTSPTPSISSILMVSHDMGTMSSFCTRLLLIHHGRLVEEGERPGAARRLPLYQRFQSAAAYLGGAA